MADTTILALTSFSTAIVVLPPPEIQLRLNAFRDGNDKSFPRWTSHLTLLFPFVEPSDLPAACVRIRESFSRGNLSPFSLKLDKVSQFKQRDYDTVYLGSSQSQDIERVWKIVSSTMGYIGRPFIPHLTLGQAYRQPGSSSTFLQEKGQLLLQDSLEWDLHSIVVLQKSTVDDGEMKIYEEIPIFQGSTISQTVISGLRPVTFYYDSINWSPSPQIHPNKVSSINVATFNILHDPAFPSVTRLSQIIETIISLQPVPDVLCLQEVTDSFLKLLLADPRMQARWSRCTHNPKSALPNERNVVCLVQLSFHWESLQLRKHKPASILQIPRFNDEPLIIAAVHLTAGLEPTHKRAKAVEFKALVAFLQRRFSSSPWIIAGDFNFSSTETIRDTDGPDFSDAWLAMYGSEEGGETYDPNVNSLASLTVKDNRTAQRYDRILLRNGKDLSLQSIQIFGRNEQASDHYGLMASIALPSQETNPPSVNVSNIAIETTNSESDVSEDDLVTFIRQDGGFSTPLQETIRENVVPALKELLTLPPVNQKVEPGSSDEENASSQRDSVVKFKVVPVGSFGLGLATESSDVDVLVIGNIPPKTFWSLFLSLLHKSILKGKELERQSVEVGMPTIILKRFIKEANVPMMELMIGGIPVDLQYCSASAVLDRWEEIPKLLPTDNIFLLPAPSLRVLSSYRIIHTIQNAVSSAFMPIFQLAYRALKLHCVSEGIYSAKFGYLGGVHLLTLLTRVAVLSSPRSSAQRLLRAFFATYAEWDWSSQAVAIPGMNDTVKYMRSQDREPIVILSIHKPTFNLVQYANQHTLAAIVSSFKRTDERLVTGEKWTNIASTGGLYGKSLQQFLDQSNSLIKVDMFFWSSNSVKARAWVGFVQSRLQHLLVSFQKVLPVLPVRLWPARLADADDFGDPASGLRSFYLVNICGPIRSESVFQKVGAILRAFEEQLHRDEKFYDSKEMFVSVSSVEASHLPTRLSAPPEWVDGGIDPIDELSDNEADQDMETLDAQDPDAAFVAVSAKQTKKNMHQQVKGNSNSSVPATKLRTSVDVYNRLLWDRGFNPENYIIGYEDRFTGIKEIPLTSWKRDVDHEEFIPFHRVMYFRQKSDGVMVWDRKKKIDLIFGSGVQNTSR